MTRERSPANDNSFLISRQSTRSLTGKTPREILHPSKMQSLGPGIATGIYEPRYFIFVQKPSSNLVSGPYKVHFISACLNSLWTGVSAFPQWAEASALENSRPMTIGAVKQLHRNRGLRRLCRRQVCAGLQASRWPPPHWSWKPFQQAFLANFPNLSEPRPLSSRWWLLPSIKTLLTHIESLASINN